MLPQGNQSLQQQNQNLLDSQFQDAKNLNPALKGKRCFDIQGTYVTVDSRYDVQNMIGCGAYGVVYSAFDSVTQSEVAIKKIQTAFADVIDAKRILREIKILKFFEHENIVKLIDIQKPIHETEYKDVYIVTEKMEADLGRLIHSKQPLTDKHYSYFMYQLLRGLLYLHSAHIMHRDIKPCNLLVNVNCDLKICDFGLARGINQSSGADMPQLANDIQYNDMLTKYVVTRWYRAPEVVLCNKNYEEGIDLWAVGCVFAELIGRQPLFQGKTHLNQVQIIQQFVGKLSADDLMSVDDENSRVYLLQNEQKLKITNTDAYHLKWQQRFPDANPLAIDLLAKLLAFNPKKRINVYDAIKHEYFKEIYQLETPPVAQVQFNWDWEYKNKELLNSIPFVKKLIYIESLYFSPEHSGAPQQIKQAEPEIQKIHHSAESKKTENQTCVNQEQQPESNQQETKLIKTEQALRNDNEEEKFNENQSAVTLKQSYDDRQIQETPSAVRELLQTVRYTNFGVEESDVGLRERQSLGHNVQPFQVLAKRKNEQDLPFNDQVEQAQEKKRARLN